MHPETKQPWSTWSNPPHVDYLDQQLLRLYSRELKRAGYLGLIIEEPPRHGKSEMASHFGPAWYLGTFPDHRVMLGSYSDEFSARWGRAVRDTLEAWGPQVFGVTVDPRSSAANAWDLKKPDKGGMITAGVGGKFTGMGGNLIVIDDPIKNYEEARSETIRDKLWNWWQTTVRTRFEPDAIVCIIATRWHEDDLIGRLLNRMAEDPQADRFVRVRLPLIAEEPDEDYPDPDPLHRPAGAVLWPGRYSDKEIQSILAPGNEQVFAAMYQQRPSPKEGSTFHKDWFEVIARPPRCRKVVRYWDLAATEDSQGEDPDWTVGCKVGLTLDDEFVVLDVVRLRGTPGAVERKIKATAIADGRVVKIRMEQEPGASGKTVIDHYRKRALRGFQFKGIRSTGDKALRADVAASRAEAGDVKLVRGTWNALFLRELTRFPNDAHDDQVDSFSGALTDLVKRGGRVASW